MHWVWGRFVLTLLLDIRIFVLQKTDCIYTKFLTRHSVIRDTFTFYKIREKSKRSFRFSQTIRKHAKKLNLRLKFFLKYIFVTTKNRCLALRTQRITQSITVCKYIAPQIRNLLEPCKSCLAALPTNLYFAATFDISVLPNIQERPIISPWKTHTQQYSHSNSQKNRSLTGNTENRAQLLSFRGYW